MRGRCACLRSGSTICLLLFFAAPPFCRHWLRDQIVRHVYLDVPHSANPKPSWNGESVGHYEGDTLVVDTIAQTTSSFVDLYRTPYSEKPHLIERYRLIEGGKALQVEMTFD